MNPKKATGPDKIPPKIIKLSANIIDSHLTNIINKDISQSKFSEAAKLASVRPLYKKKGREKIENYRPVSILNCFSKVYEKFLLAQFKPFVNNILSDFIAAYRENYSSKHVLLRLIENWKKALDNKYLVGTILMDLSKAFDCIPHDLLIAKLYAYGFGLKTTTYIYSYLKRRKQNVKIDDIFSELQTLISGVPQGSILGPMFFNIFLNDLVGAFNKADLYNFADDNTISFASKNETELLCILKEESDLAVKWFRQNNMIVNPDKFQSMLLGNFKKDNSYYQLDIDKNMIETTNYVELLGIKIDNELKFNDHISDLCSKASMQLNAISRLKRYMGQNELEIVINSFIYSNFNYCPLVWNFCSCKSSKKIEQIHKRCLRIILDDNESNYATLLEKNNTCSMEIKRMRTLAIEIFKTINNLNPNFMKDIFKSKINPRVRPFDITVSSHNTATFGDKSLLTLGPKIWNALPEKVKSETCYVKFKEYIKMWSGPTCNCNACKNF